MGESVNIKVSFLKINLIKDISKCEDVNSYKMSTTTLMFKIFHQKKLLVSLPLLVLIFMLMTSQNTNKVFYNIQMVWNKVDDGNTTFLFVSDDGLTPTKLELSTSVSYDSYLQQVTAVMDKLVTKQPLLDSRRSKQQIKIDSNYFKKKKNEKQTVIIFLNIIRDLRTFNVKRLNILQTLWAQITPKPRTYGNYRDRCTFSIEDFILGGGTTDIGCLVKCFFNSQSFTEAVFSREIFLNCQQRYNCFPSHFYMRQQTAERQQDGVHILTHCSIYDKSSMCQNQLSDNITDKAQHQDRIEVRNTNYNDAHIAFASDANQFLAMLTSIKSIIKSSSFRHNLFFHIFICADCKDALTESQQQTLQQVINSYKVVQLQYHRFSSPVTEPFINFHNTGRPDLTSPNNYIRFLIPSILANVSKCLWLDCDTVVLRDIVPFIHQNVSNHKVISAFPLYNMRHITQNDYEKFRQAGVNVSKNIDPGFHAGVMAINLDLWRLYNITDQILTISKLNREHAWYKTLGSQGPLGLLFSGKNFHHLNPELYKGGLGWHTSQWIPCQAFFLHWNGSNKPWQKFLWPRNNYKELWDQFK